MKPSHWTTWEQAEGPRSLVRLPLPDHFAKPSWSQWLPRCPYLKRGPVGAGETHSAPAPTCQLEAEGNRAQRQSWGWKPKSMPALACLWLPRKTISLSETQFPPRRNWSTSPYLICAPARRAGSREHQGSSLPATDEETEAQGEARDTQVCLEG